MKLALIAARSSKQKQTDQFPIGDKNYNFTQFKIFSLIEGSAMPSIQLLPQKKFAVPVSIFVSPEDIDLVINTLGNYLPFEKKQRDFVDKLSSRLRF